jgi:hypothetical protein
VFDAEGRRSAVYETFPLLTERVEDAKIVCLYDFQTLGQESNVVKVAKVLYADGLYQVQVSHHHNGFQTIIHGSKSEINI